MDKKLQQESIHDAAIRPALDGDLHKVIALDARITGLEKTAYWTETFDRFVGKEGRYFLIAETGAGDFAGFIVGEIRAWEFGSQPCGWILTILVNPEVQGRGIGDRLYQKICGCLKGDGVDTIRTMIARDDNLNMSFFRAQGMMAGPFIELERPID